MFYRLRPGYLLKVLLKKACCKIAAFPNTMQCFNEWDLYLLIFVVSI